MDQRPIGVFDSGLGGLTAVQELTRLLPGEDIIYFGDTEDPAQSRMSPVQWVLMMAVAAILVLGAINLFGIEAPALAAAQSLVR